MRVCMRPTVTMSILLAEGEQVIRKYNCVSANYASSDKNLDNMGIRKKRADTDGVVVVTNKRVIYYAESRTSKGSNLPSMHLQEAFIDRVASTEFIQADGKKNAAFPIALVVIGLLVLMFGILDKTNLMYVVPGIAVLAIGAMLTVLSLTSAAALVMMKINTVSTETGIHVSGISRKEEQSIAFYMVPTEDFRKMAAEIGALILDIQANGDGCIAKWTSQ